MRHLKLIVSYDGTAYGGFQRQRNARTVQAVLEETLRKILKEKVRLLSAGRTDAGVHAEGQVVSFKTKQDLPLLGLQRGLNALLPKDIVIRSAKEAIPDFHPRFDASLKEYRYTLWNDPTPSPFWRHYAHHVPHPLDLKAMRKAAHYLVGHHDFKSFQAADKRRRSAVRTLKRLFIRRKGSLIQITFQADGFVYHMVRNIVGTLLEVGKGRRSPAEIPALLSKKDRRFTGPTAPAKGLCLVKVGYP